MTNEQLAAMHRLLAEHHGNLAKEAVLDVVQQYHANLARRLADEAALIPRRRAILERLREGEQQKKGGWRPLIHNPVRPKQNPRREPAVPQN